MRLPIRTRLTLVATALMAVVLVVVGVLGAWRIDAQLTSAVDAGLRSRAELVVAAISGGGEPELSGALVEVDEAFAWVVAADGSVPATSPGLGDVENPLPDETTGTAVPTFVEQPVRTTEEMLPARLLVVPLPDGTTVVVGASLEDQHEARTQLIQVGLAGGALTLALTSLVIWLVAGAALRPVERMRRDAAKVSSADLGHRLPVPDTGDELARLAGTLNEMLDRLDSALQRERRLIGDASHELRTPLANLRAEVDVALRDPTDPARLGAALVSVGEETDRLTRLTQELLMLAQADQGQLGLRRRPVDVAELIDLVVNAFTARAEQMGVDIAVTRPAELVVEADRERLRQALDNVIDNALRHSPAGGTIEVLTAPDSAGCSITVLDVGPGFDPEFLPAALEPFTRSDAGRARSHGGAGLGLAIVRAIVEAHGGELTVSNLPSGGAEVAILLPRR